MPQTMPANTSRKNFSRISKSIRRSISPAISPRIIVAIDGKRVTSSDGVAALVADRLVPGEVARFTVIRDGRRRVVPVRLGTRPG